MNTKKNEGHSLLHAVLMNILFIIIFQPNAFTQTLVQPTKVPLYAVNDFIGANILRTAYLPKLRSVGNVREYHDWILDLGYQNSTPSSPGYPNHKYKRKFARDGFNTDFDALYNTIKLKGIAINSALTGTCTQIVFPQMQEWQYGTWALEKMPLNYNNASIIDNPVAEISVPTNVAAATTPSTWANYADWLSSAAGRYGNNQSMTAAQKAWLDTHSEPSDAGIYALNRLSYIEAWNEQNKNWRGLVGIANQYDYTRFAPYQYAAMLSAAYDGHNGTVTAPGSPSIQLGIKKFDANLKLAAGGVADIHKKYIDSVLDWCTVNRVGYPQQYPLDVINLHVVNNYCTELRNGNASSYYNTGGTMTGITLGCSGSKPVSPEKDQVRSKLFGFFDATLTGASTPGHINYNSLYRQFATAATPKEFWISEFGYATDNSMQGTSLAVPDYQASSAPAAIKAKFDKQEIQADWIVRDILEIQGGGWDRAMIYWYQDDKGIHNDARDNAGIGGWDKNCGIIKNEQNNAQPKKAFYYVATLKNLLTGYKFKGEITQGCTANPNDVYSSASVCPKVYQFENGTNVAWVAWYPTSNAIEKNNIAVKLGNKRANGTTISVTSVQVVNLEYPSETGYNINNALTYNTGNITLPTLSERPSIIFTNLPTANRTNPTATTGLQVKARYENIIKLGWTVPSVVPDKYQVWYKRLQNNDSTNNTLIPFDIGVSMDPTGNTGLGYQYGNNNIPMFVSADYGFKLYSDEISGKDSVGTSLVNRTTAVIAGLDPNAKYAFYVVPVLWINKSTPTANPVYKALPAAQCQGVVTSTNSGVNARIPLTTSNTEPASAELLNNQSFNFSASALYQNIIPGTAWNNFSGSVINFGSKKKIDAIQYFRVYGLTPTDIYYYNGSSATPPAIGDPKWKKIGNTAYTSLVNIPGGVSNCGGTTITETSIGGCENWLIFSDLTDDARNPLPTTQYVKLVSVGSSAYQIREIFFFTATDNVCTPPAAPTAVTATPSTINAGQTSALTASGCTGGTISFYNASTNLQVFNPVSPAVTTTYYARCSVNGCTSANSTSTATITVNPPLCLLSFTSFQRIADEIAPADTNNCRDYKLTIQANSSAGAGTTIAITNLPGNGYTTFAGPGSLNYVTQTSFNWVLPAITAGQLYTVSIKYCWAGPNWTTATATYSPCNLVLNTTNLARTATGAETGITESGNLKIFPNPSTIEKCTVQFYSKEKGNGMLILTSSAGQTIFRRNILMRKGLNREELRLTGLPNGTYMVKISGINGDEQKGRLVKE
ncbi:MAG: T9SS type A sorting domain-containing protein [Ferruginibacter sp.]